MILSFGKYKGKNLEYVINQNDGVEHLNWYIKRLNNYIENVNFSKYKELNLKYKQEIEHVLNKINNNSMIEEFNIQKATEVENQKTEIKTDSEAETIVEEKTIKDIKVKEVDSDNFDGIELTSKNINDINDFEKLVDILEQLLLSKLDVKFRKSYNISKQYRDYVCLRTTLKTYNEIIKEKNVTDIKNICLSLTKSPV